MMLAAYDRYSNQLISVSLSNSELVNSVSSGTDILLLNLQLTSTQILL